MGAQRSVVILARNLPPLVGGMERLNLEMVRTISRSAECHVVGPNGCEKHLPDTARAWPVPLRPLWLFALAMAWRSMRLGWGARPGWIVAGSGLSAPFALLAARLCGARCAVYVHGLDIIVDSWLYRRAWLPAIRRMDLVLANSGHTGELARSAGVSADRIRVINPGVDIPVDAPQGGWRVRHGLSGRKVMLSVGRLTRRKGLAEFVRHALPAIVAAHPDSVLVVIGEEPAEALVGHGGRERQRIIEAADAVGLGDHVMLLGRCDDVVLAAAYAEADVLVFPVCELPHDVEGFGMVALEAAAHGLRTVAFAVGGVPDAVAEAISGRLVPAGDYAGFAQAIMDLLLLPPDDGQRRACMAFAATKAWPHFAEQLVSALAVPSHG